MGIGSVVHRAAMAIERRWDAARLARRVRRPPQHLRIERLVALRGLTEEEARARVSSQASDEERLALADVVIDSSGTLEETLARTDALWERLAR